MEETRQSYLGREEMEFKSHFMSHCLLGYNISVSVGEIRKHQCHLLEKKVGVIAIATMEI